MNARSRPLVEGLKPAADPALEKDFVYHGKPKPAHQPPPAEPREGKGQAASSGQRLPLTTRIRADYATALKRASLQRQLDGVVPNSLQEILEEALEPWLRANGYLT